MGDILSGGSAQFTIDVTVNSDAPITLTNNVVVSSDTADPNEGNNSATENTAVEQPNADLSISKSDSADPVMPGDSLTYTVIVNNAGPETAENVVVTDTLPAGVTFVSTTGCDEDASGVPKCSLGDIVSGGDAQFTIDVTVNSDAPITLTNTASVASDTADSVPGNNSTTEDTTVITPPSTVDGFMVGGGRVITSSTSNIGDNPESNEKKNAKAPGDTFILSHGFQLHCNVNHTPNNLQINWQGNSFHLENLESAICIDDGTTNEPPKSPKPGPTLDTYTGEGSGRLNGVDGARAEWIFTDNGEPGKNDEILKLIIKNENGDTVLEITDGVNLKGGNHQFVPHKSSHHK